MSSDGGGVLLRQADDRLGLTRRLAACFTAHRKPGYIDHTVAELLAQRIDGLALGYEDLNDHYRHRCYLPMYAYCGEYLLSVAPRAPLGHPAPGA